MKIAELKIVSAVLNFPIPDISSFAINTVIGFKTGARQA